MNILNDNYMFLN